MKLHLGDPRYVARVILFCHRRRDDIKIKMNGRQTNRISIKRSFASASSLLFFFFFNLEDSYVTRPNPSTVQFDTLLCQRGFTR